MAGARRRCSPPTSPSLPGPFCCFPIRCTRRENPSGCATEHFPRVKIPALFVHGTADPFGSIAELRLAVALIPAPTRVLPVERAGHDLRRGRFDLDAVVAAARDQLGVI
jgi:predicted alpha/beta-hydrolase family hydrolase